MDQQQGVPKNIFGLADWEVPIRYIAEIGRLAESWRLKALEGKKQKYTDVIYLLETLLKPYFSASGRGAAKGTLKITLVESECELDGSPASVTFSGGFIDLKVVREVYFRAQIGHEKERFIIAHEIGHILLHSGSQPHRFSRDADGGLKSAQLEKSAEWQANTFAYFLLLPIEKIARLDVYTAATLYLAEEQRIQEFVDTLIVSPDRWIQEMISTPLICDLCGEIHEPPAPLKCKTCNCRL